MTGGGVDKEESRKTTITFVLPIVPTLSLLLCFRSCCRLIVVSLCLHDLSNVAAACRASWCSNPTTFTKKIIEQGRERENEKSCCMPASSSTQTNKSMAFIIVLFFVVAKKKKKKWKFRVVLTSYACHLLLPAAVISIFASLHARCLVRWCRT